MAAHNDNNETDSAVVLSQVASLSIDSVGETGLATPTRPIKPDTAKYHLLSHPTNRVIDSGHKEVTEKPWVQPFLPLTRLLVRTRVRPDGWVEGDFAEAFLPEFGDQQERDDRPCSATGPREYSFKTKDEVEEYFRIELSDVVLTAWALFSVAENHEDGLFYPVPGNKAIEERVDILYSYRPRDGKKMTVAIGMIKLREIDCALWQSGDIRSSESQMNLSRELRGYSETYGCPHIFCFDGDTLLVLQFRAVQESQLRDDDCPVDCWVIPRTRSVTSMRDALNRLMTQGYRRAKGRQSPYDMEIDGVRFTEREFFTAQPLWELENGVRTTSHPGGWKRSINRGLQFQWIKEGNRPRTEFHRIKPYDRLS